MSSFAQYNREQKARYYALRDAEAAKETSTVQAVMRALETILKRTVGTPSYAIDFSTLVKPLPYPLQDWQGLDVSEKSPELDTYLPPRPSLLTRLVPALLVQHEDKVRGAEQRFQDDVDAWRTRESFRKQKLQQIQDEYRRRCDDIDSANKEEEASINLLESKCHDLDPIAISDYFSRVLQRYWALDTRSAEPRAAYMLESRHLVVEVDAPPTNIVPSMASFKYVKKSDQVVPVRQSSTSIRSAYGNMLAQISLGVVYVAFTADCFNAIETLTVNVFVQTIDRSIGKPARPCLVSVRCSRETFSTLDLSNVDPVACLKGLHAQVSRSAHELEPVKPLIEFNMADPRFVEKQDILARLDGRPNLADLSPGEFESLMTNLFEKMGLETKLTRPSRDGGVDCVAWNMSPVLGGKVVIQAKRYRRTVGVSAVRDLYGTLMNEGAAKGILVTTSGYGKSAFEFANNKPLELITGSNLLYLLKQYAGIDAKIEFPDDWADPVEQEV